MLFPSRPVPLGSGWRLSAAGFDLLTALERSIGYVIRGRPEFVGPLCLENVEIPRIQDDHELRDARRSMRTTRLARSWTTSPAFDTFTAQEFWGTPSNLAVLISETDVASR